MTNFHVPTREEVSEKNKELFDKMQKSLKMVPNLYATLAYSENALEAYLNLENSPTSLSNKQVEVVNLAVSEVNGCTYCLSAHVAIAKTNGFSEDETKELRDGKASFDPNIDVLARLTRRLTEYRGHVDAALIEEFFAAGYTKENLVDVIMLVGDRTISNILYAVTQVPIDFPVAAKL